VDDIDGKILFTQHPDLKNLMTELRKNQEEIQIFSFPKLKEK